MVINTLENVEALVREVDHILRNCVNDIRNKMVGVLPAICFMTFIVMCTAELRCPRARSTSCDCSNVSYGYELICPTFTVQVKPKEVVFIQCYSSDVVDFTLLDGMQIGNVNTLMIRLCTLPAVSLSQLMQNMGVANVSNVQITYTGALHGNSTTTVTRELFQHLSNITSLTLHTNGIAQLPVDVFTDMPNLTLLDLKNNNVVLPKTIFRSVSKLEVLELGSNNLTYLEPGVFHNLTHLRLLNLWGNALRNLSRAVFSDVHNLESLDINSNKMTGIPPDLFVDLIKLRKINLYANEFLSLPQNLFINNPELETVNLQDNRRTLKTLPPRLLANLTKLKEVKLHSCNMSSLPEDLLWGSKSINIITLNKNAFSTLPELLFKDSTELQTVDLSFNRITDLPDRMFYNTGNLKVLRLNNNQLSTITDYLFSSLNKLEFLDLKNNRLTHIGTDAFISLNSLKAVNISNNMLTFGDASVSFFGTGSPLHECHMLEDIQLANNSLTEIFTDWKLSMNNLETVNLAYNKISKIRTADLQFTGMKKISVDIRYNNISEIDFSDAERIFTYSFQTMNPYERDSVPVRRFFVEGNPIICDCKVYSLLQYFGDKIAPEVKAVVDIQPGNLQCAKPEAYAGQLVENIPLKHFTCLLEKENNRNCPAQCSCSYRPSDETLVIDCQQKNLTSMPEALPDREFSNYTELYLSGNRIKSVTSPLGPGYDKVIKYILSDNMISEINVTAFSPKLQVLEIDGNNITQLNESSIEFLKNSKYLTKLTLHRNPWTCDCTTKDFVSLIQTHLEKIKLLNNITCDNGKPLLDMSDTELCPIKTILIVGSSFTIAVLGLVCGIFGALYYRFQKEIKVWLYAHRYCLWFVTEEELDQDKTYDAFVSYSHQDEGFVTDHLVPGLENGPTKYKLCLHYRNWIAGEYIPTQIARSVEESRRTIVVLSPNFLESVWGRMEFRAAHKQALSEGRVRVIVILYGDIGPTDKLDPELRAYLTMNTYVKWGDPWFWDKLRYALPHPLELRKGIPLQEKRKPKLDLTDKSGLMTGSDPNASPPAVTTPPANSLIISPLEHMNGQIKTIA